MLYSDMTSFFRSDVFTL